MHVIDVIGKNPLGLPEGEFVVEDVNAGEMLSRGWGKVRSASGVAEKLFDPSKDWNNQKILFVRPGGFGDLLFLTPTFAELKRRWPGLEIHVACFDRFKSALENNPDVDGFVGYPVRLGSTKGETPSTKPQAPGKLQTSNFNGEGELAWDDFDAHIWLEGVIEQNSKALTVHAVDLIAGRLGLALNPKHQIPNPNGRAMRYFVTEEELAAAEDEFPRREDVRRVGFQMSASGSCRMYPHMSAVTRILWMNHKCEIFLFGRPGDLKSNEFPLSDPASGEPPGIVNLMMRGKTFRESCAILATCDVVVGPDSALVHVAGAMRISAANAQRPTLNAQRPMGNGDSAQPLNPSTFQPIPCVALYGPFPWHLRTKYAPETFAIQGVGACSPCFFHQRPGTGQYPENGPCAKTGRCEVLAAIEPERVAREVMKKLDRIDEIYRITGDKCLTKPALSLIE